MNRITSRQANVQIPLSIIASSGMVSRYIYCRTPLKAFVNLGAIS